MRFFGPQETALLEEFDQILLVFELSLVKLNLNERAMMLLYIRYSAKTVKKKSSKNVNKKIMKVFFEEFLEKNRTISENMHI